MKFNSFRRDNEISDTVDGGNEDEDESIDEDQDEEIQKILGKKGKGQKVKKRPGRKAQWPETLLTDMVDIIVTNDYFKRKLIFTNSKNQKNADVYQKVLNELKKRAESRGKEVPFTVIQLRTKFKKVVAECKKAALVMKTATGIKRFQEEHGYGSWFNQLFALVKTRDSCQPEQAIEPSSKLNETSESNSPGQHSSEPSACDSPDLFVPVKKSKKDKSENQLQGVVRMLQRVVEQDPMKEFLQFAKEEAEKSRQHELQLVQLMMGQTQQQTYQQLTYQNQTQNTPKPQGFLSYLQQQNNENNEDLPYYQY